MLGGEWTSLEREFEAITFGMGLTHMARYVPPPPDCERCFDTRQVGNPLFPVACPDCTPQATTPD